MACTKTRNAKTKPSKRNDRNHRNDQNETTETKRPKQNDRNETESYTFDLHEVLSVFGTKSQSINIQRIILNENQYKIT